MKIFVPLNVLLLVVVLVRSFEGIPEPAERSRPIGFYPQVRVGRAGNFYNPSTAKKAAKMTIFPRVGRGSTKLFTGSDCDERHVTRDTSSNLWFGPRLGVHKRNNYEQPLSYILLNGGHGSRMEYIPFQDKDFEAEIDNDKLDFGSLN